MNEPLETSERAVLRIVVVDERDIPGERHVHRWQPGPLLPDADYAPMVVVVCRCGQAGRAPVGYGLPL